MLPVLPTRSFRPGASVSLYSVSVDRDDWGVGESCLSLVEVNLNWLGMGTSDGWYRRINICLRGGLMRHLRFN